MTSTKRRTRQSNFSLEEKQLLVDFVKENAHIVEYKGVDHRIHKSKNACWVRCSHKFKTRGFTRDASKLKDTYHRMKHAAKVNIRQYKQQAKQFHISTQKQLVEPPSDIDYAIMRICPADFQVSHEFIDTDFYFSELAEVKEEPEFVTNDVPDSYFKVDSDSYMSEAGETHHSRLNGYFEGNTPPVVEISHTKQDKLQPASEAALTEYHNLKIKHEIELHQLKIEAAKSDERRKVELHEKLMEEQSLKIIMLRKKVDG